MNAGTRLRLDYADALIGAEEFTGMWPRCVCWLMRLALERELRQFWLSRCPEMAACSARAQLLTLGRFAGDETQRRAAQLWHTLSRAGHHHQYELAPTEAELRSWLDESRLLMAMLNGQS
jgi:hypothetical protein